MGGFFTPGARLLERFTKPALDIASQLRLVTERGLILGDPAAAARHLQHISFYRLSGYALPFQKGGTGADRHHFRPGTTFDQILERYTFDRKLRLLVMDAVERIEISVRAAMSDAIAVQHGSHWYMQPGIFETNFNHSSFIDEVKRQIAHDPKDSRKRDVHIAHYYGKYCDPYMPACWMIFESISFGTISRMYKNLAYQHRKLIASPFSVSETVLSSWLHSISYVRNVCAHHSRLWNREFRITPVSAKAYKADLTPNTRLYAQLVVMQVLLKVIAPGNHWADRLKALLDEHPNIPLVNMGIPAGWSSRPIWT